MSTTVQRNFHLPTEQAEWLRDYAHRTRRSQAEIVREALDEHRERVDVAPSVDEEERREALLRLANRFVTGDGIDLEGMRRRDAWPTDR